jgi:hypothetical protein
MCKQIADSKQLVIETSDDIETLFRAVQVLSVVRSKSQSHFCGELSLDDLMAGFPVGHAVEPLLEGSFLISDEATAADNLSALDRFMKALMHGKKLKEEELRKSRNVEWALRGSMRFRTVQLIELIRCHRAHIRSIKDSLQMDTQSSETRETHKMRYEELQSILAELDELRIYICRKVEGLL